MERVSIIIPVTRFDKSRDCVAAIDKNAGVPKNRYEIIPMLDKDGVGCPEMVKRLTEHAKCDLVMFLGDDTIPEPDFLEHAIDAMNSLPDGWGVVGLNTQDIRVENGNPLAHWMAHKKMLDHIPGGNFFPTDYAHCWCDNELKDIADEMGRWVYAKKSKIIHNHPINQTAEYDDTLQKAYSEDNRTHDFKTYCHRKRARMQERYGVKLAIGVPLTDQWVYTQFFFSFIKVITEYMSSLIKNGKSISFDVFMPDFPCQVDAARNNLVMQALQAGCTHILMMDTDQMYNTSNMIDRLLAHDKPVVGARVHRRYPPFDPLLLRGEVGKLYQVPDDEIKDASGEFKTEVPVDYTGAGCIMFDMKIFNDLLPAKWFQFKTGDQGQPVGEDIAFCDVLKEHNIPIIVDCSIDIKHLTLLSTDWGTYKLYTKLSGGQHGTGK